MIRCLRSHFTQFSPFRRYRQY